MRHRWVALVVVSLFLSGCGTRVTRSAYEAQPRAGVPEAQTGGGSSQPSDQDPEPVPPTAATVLPAPAGGRPGSSPPGGRAAGTQTRTTVPVAGPSASPGQSRVPSPRGPAAPEEGATPRPAALAPPAERPPFVLGSVGTMSGPLGAAFSGVPPALQVWSKLVNDRGGINGHRVQLILADDGGDPARHKALVQEFVERRGVLAFVSALNVVTGSAAVKYLEDQRVPVVGGDLGSHLWDTSPMHFPNGTTVAELLYAAFATPARFTPKRRLALWSCAEAQACRDANTQAEALSKRAGMELVFKAQVSLAQPDFTAECLGAAQARAEVVLVFLDVNGVLRAANACARQNFRPTYMLPGATVDEREAKDPNLDGALAAIPTAPYFVSDVAALREFATAMDRYAPTAPRGASSTVAWSSVKIFERVAATLADPPTRPALLDALWQVRGETFGGLTQPLTYRRDAPHGAVACWYVQKVVGREWVAPQGAAPVCP